MRSFHALLFSFAVISLTTAAAPPAGRAPEFHADLGSGKTPWGTLQVYDRLKPIKTTPPRFPLEAMRSGISGTVHAMVLIAADGSVEDVKVRQSSGHRSLDDAGVAALKQWKYAAPPGGVRVMSLQPVVFSLTGGK